MTYSLFNYLPKLFPFLFLALLTGCASGPPIYKSSEIIEASFKSLQTTDPKVQSARFGVYSRAAGKSFIGIYDGDVLAVSYFWIIPGVALEKKIELPWRQRLVLQYNPDNRMIDVFNLLENRTAHIRELSVHPDESVEWPAAVLGIVPAYRKTMGKNGSLDQTDASGETQIMFREVTHDEFQSKLAEVRAYRNSEAREKSRARSEFLNAVSQGLGQASREIRTENQARQLREAEKNSEIMRSKDAEMRASSRRLAAQQRESEARERQQAEQKARNNKAAVGYITFDDNTERDRKAREDMAERKRQINASDEAARKVRAEGKAEWAAKVAAEEAKAAKKRSLIHKNSTATVQ